MRCRNASYIKTIIFKCARFVFLSQLSSFEVQGQLCEKQTERNRKNSTRARTGKATVWISIPKPNLMTKFSMRGDKKKHPFKASWKTSAGDIPKVLGWISRQCALYCSSIDCKDARCYILLNKNEGQIEKTPSLDCLRSENVAKEKDKLKCLIKVILYSVCRTWADTRLS